MQEKADFKSGELFPQELREEHKLIIMDPDSVPRLDDFQSFFAKSLVDLFVNLPKTVFPYSAGGKVVKKRPDRFVAKAQIILLYLFPGEENG